MITGFPSIARRPAGCEQGGHLMAIDERLRLNIQTKLTGSSAE
jgi:hypothetical protein